MPPESADFRDRLRAVEERIAGAAERSGRTRSDITLVAVSKKFSADRIEQAYAAGTRIFGENYVQEFAGKWPELKGMEGARFHLIGHLQSNKSRQACDLFSMVQTVDSAKLMERLNTAAGERGQPLDILIEVKLSDETNKTGAPPESLPSLVESAASSPHLHLKGLMTVPPWSEDQELSRPYFRRLAQLAREHGLEELSMGMSGDFEAAIEEGATIVRIGTALFGARPKPAASARVPSSGP